MNDGPLKRFVDAWIEQVGYCEHQPTHTDSELCREQRARERKLNGQPEPVEPTVFRGEATVKKDGKFW